MKAASIKPVRCAIYTRVSTDHGLDQEFNSLDANGQTYDSLSKVAFAITGTRWNGPRFFGLRDKEDRSTAEARS